MVFLHCVAFYADFHFGVFFLRHLFDLQQTFCVCHSIEIQKYSLDHFSHRSFYFVFSLFYSIFFAVNIRALNESGLWTVDIRLFGSIYFSIYSFLVIFFETIIPLALIVYLNCVLAFKYHQYQQRRNNLVLTSTQSSTVKVIVIKTTLIIIVDLLDMVALALVRISVTKAIEFNDLMRQSINLFRNFVYLLYFINQSIDVFIFVFYDKNISKAVRVSKIYKKVGLNLF